MVLSCNFRPTVILFLQEEVPTYGTLGKDQACTKISFKIDDDDDDND